ncbi:MAG: hypothetical protein JW894_02915 [Bacteroidales bacterium]|nr:hypothetical protein [Bacteroidales bacterium]
MDESGHYIESESFYQKETIFGGMLGFRYSGKRLPRNAGQIGLIYIFAKHGDIPDNYNDPGWVFEQEKSYFFLLFPIITFSTRFGRKY